MTLDQDVLLTLEAFPAAVRVRMDQFRDAELRRQTAAGEFALVEHLCHLRDYDLEGCQQRIRRMLSDEVPALFEFEGERLAIEREYLRHDPQRAAEEFADARRASCELIATLSNEQLARRGRFGAEDEITIRDLIVMVAEHDATHLAEIDALLAELRAEGEILAAIDGFRAAYESGDLARLADYYCDDLLKLRQGAAAETKDVVLERVAGVFEAYQPALDVDNEEIRVRGDLAVVRGRFVVTLTPRRAGEPARIARRFLEVWCRHSGRWAVCRTMDNAETA